MKPILPIKQMNKKKKLNVADAGVGPATTASLMGAVVFLSPSKWLRVTLIHHFGKYRNISNTKRWIIIHLGADTHGPQGINPTDFSSSTTQKLTFCCFC